jgi:hypothetical protein
LNRACNEITGFSELLQRFERNISILGQANALLKIIRAMWPQWYFILVLYQPNYIPNKLKIISLNCNNVPIHLRNRILNTLFTDFDFF